VHDTARSPLARRLPHRSHAIAFAAAFAVVFVVSAIAPRYRADWLLENWLVFALLGWLARGYRKAPLSPGSYAAIFTFLMLHEVGAHYTYSEVPYDRAFEHLTGTGLNAMLGWQRNHYDRLVHFSYGVLLVYPIRELLLRSTNARGFTLYVVSLNSTLACSAWYELIEWGAATLFGGELGMAYLGTQGDVWDAQWDMALATLGAFTSLVLTAAHARVRGDAAARWTDALAASHPRA
jgi:putative membrane protein